MPHRDSYIAGTSFRDGAVEFLNALGNDGEVEFVLEPEPDNEHDPNAIKVLSPDATMHLGYVPRAQAAEVGELLASGRITKVVRPAGRRSKLEIHYEGGET